MDKDKVLFGHAITALSKLFGSGKVDADPVKNAAGDILWDASLVTIDFSRFPSKDELVHELNVYMRKNIPNGKEPFFIPVYVKGHESRIAIRADKLFEPKVVTALQKLNFERVEHELSKFAPPEKKETSMTIEEVRAFMAQEEIPTSPAIEQFFHALQEQNRRPPQKAALPMEPIPVKYALETLEFVTGAVWAAHEIGNSRKYTYYTTKGFPSAKEAEKASNTLMKVLGKKEEGYPAAVKLPHENTLSHQVAIMSGWLTDENFTQLFDRKNLLLEAYSALAEKKLER